MAKEVPTEIKVTHPEFGHVTFTGMTGRQADILRLFQESIDNVKNIPNDRDFGTAIRVLLT